MRPAIWCIARWLGVWFHVDWWWLWQCHSYTPWEMHWQSHVTLYHTSMNKGWRILHIHLFPLCLLGASHRTASTMPFLDILRSCRYLFGSSLTMFDSDVLFIYKLHCRSWGVNIVKWCLGRFHDLWNVFHLGGRVSSTLDFMVACLYKACRSRRSLLKPCPSSQLRMRGLVVPQLGVHKLWKWVALLHGPFGLHLVGYLCVPGKNNTLDL